MIEIQYSSELDYLQRILYASSKAISEHMKEGQASLELDYLKMSEEERNAYNKYQKNRHHEASIYESTYVIGQIEERKKIALNLLKAKVNKEIIKQTTGLTDIEIENLTNCRN